MRVSVITPVLNGRYTIGECIKCAIGQSYNDIEYIIIDGGSTDGTLEIINKYKNKITKVISEPDNGIYDAMNKGIQLATGNIIAIINSDDIYADKNVIERVVKTLSNRNVESCYGDLVYVDKYDINKTIRYWRAGDYYKARFKRGWMPPHPTFFCKKSVYEKYGLFNLDFPLAADYEIMVRFLYKNNISTIYIPKVLVKMRTGGTSKPGSYTMRAIKENYRSWKVNGLNYPITVLLKPYLKVFQFINRKKETDIH